jgi:hypothetical protein
MFFNNYYYYYYILYFIFIILQNNITTSFRISYNDLKENQIIDLIYFPCHGHCIKLNHDSHVHIRFNPTLSNRNQFLFKKNQADIW